jgi:hypothetical protein
LLPYEKEIVEAIQSHVSLDDISNERRKDDDDDNDDDNGSYGSDSDDGGDVVGNDQ